MIIFPEINKILFSIGPLKVHWYGLAYFFGILIGLFLAGKINKKNKIFENKSIFEEFILWLIIALILGGRLGYVLIYNLAYYLQHPLEILMPWKGGMAFHGAFAGLTIFLIYFSRKHKIQFLKLTDLLSFSCFPGVFFGRVANFINQELKGAFISDPSRFPFGVLFPGESWPRHASQIYEALFEGLIPFIILLILNLKFKFFDSSKKLTGLITSFFLIFYGLSRFIIEEFFRLPDPGIGYVIFEKFTIGQAFCFMMITIGILILIYKKNDRSL